LGFLSPNLGIVGETANDFAAATSALPQVTAPINDDFHAGRNAKMPYARKYRFGDVLRFDHTTKRRIVGDLFKSRAAPASNEIGSDRSRGN
jgi:hypothetical protein